LGGYVLAAGPRRMRKPFDQLGCWHSEPMRRSWPSWYLQVLHVHQCGIVLCVEVLSRHPRSPTRKPTNATASVQCTTGDLIVKNHEGLGIHYRSEECVNRSTNSAAGTVSP